MRWHEGDSLARAEDDVTGHHRGGADADGAVHLGQGDIQDGGRVYAAAEDIEVGELVDALQIANAAVDDDPGPGAGRDSGPQVVADEGAILDLAEEIDDQHVAREQRVDDPRVLAAAATLGGAHALDDPCKSGRNGTMRTVTARPTRTRSG